jgi:uncharacterized membrane protein
VDSDIAAILPGRRCGIVPAVTDIASSLAPRSVAGAAASPGRYDRLDAWRGIAIVWMACFHFSFDLNLPEFGHLLPRQSFPGDPFWTMQRACIVSMFLLGAGAGQAMAIHLGQTWRRFWRRWAQVAGCAALVSAGSALMFPRSWISFGVLHGMAVMLVLMRLIGTRLPPMRIARSPAAFASLVLLGSAAWLLPHVAANPFFDARATNWVGLVTKLPVTEDYVPVLPWFGTLLAGYLVASLLIVHVRVAFMRPVPAGLRSLSVLGRWSLSFYMLHQPILIGSLMLFHDLLR